MKIDGNPSMSSLSPPRVTVLIVGAGFGGIAMAHYLQAAGETDFLLLERSHDVGGVWRDNTYPGCACDVQSHLYSFSFAPNPDWTRRYSPQAEILAYLRRVVATEGLLPKIRFDHEVTRMDWSEAVGEWAVTTSRGVYRARYVVSAFGSLSDPEIPELPGVDSFEGRVMHSATWPRDFEPKGLKVAVIGTGASAIQFVPAIQPAVAKLTLFQRTPPWVLPRDDGPIDQSTRDAYGRQPALMRAERQKIHAEREALAPGFKDPRLMQQMQNAALNHLNSAVADPALRARLTPEYTLGCKRILISNTYYPALAQPNVEVTTAGVREVVANGVVDTEGRLHEADAIIFGTGFKTRDLPFAHTIHDARGRTLADAWAGSPKAYLGTTVYGFPNLFLMHGPNIGLGHSSVVLMMEAQAEHIVGVIGLAKQKGYDIVEPTAEAQAGFVEQIERDMQGTVWTAGGCSSWYLDRTGRNSTLWPSTTDAYAEQVRCHPEDNYAGRQAVGASAG